MLSAIACALVTLFGIIFFPHLTLFFALCLLGHPILGFIALIRGFVALLADSEG